MVTITVIALGATLIVAMFTRDRFRSVYRKRLEEEYPNGPTGAEMAREIIRSSGVKSIEVVEHKGAKLGDHYDERRKRLVLASANYHGKSAGAVGVAAHEAGHALQHASGYAALLARQSAVRATLALSGLIFIFCAVLLIALPGRVALLGLGVSWGLILLYNLATMPVEFDASRRAKEAIENMSAKLKVAQMEGIYAMMKACEWRYTGAFLGPLRHVPYHLFPSIDSKK
jgi:Zn-dependent membrane protease YugP